MFKKILFITTIILILSQLLFVPASAAEAISYPPISAKISYDKFDANGNNVVVNKDMGIYEYDKIPTGDASGNMYAVANTGLLSSFPWWLCVVDSLYGHTSGTASQAWINVEYDLASFRELNTLWFCCNVFVDPHQTDFSDYFKMVLDNDEEFTDYTMSIVTSPVVNAVWGPSGVSYSYKRLNIAVNLNEPYQGESLNVKFYVKTYLPSTDITTRYCMGFFPIKADKLTQEEFVASIASQVSGISNQIGQTNEKLDEVNENLTIVSDNIQETTKKVEEIVDGLKEELSPEQQEKLDTVRENIVFAKTAQVAVDEEFLMLWQKYDEIEYDLFDKSALDKIMEYIPLSDGYINFWYSLWSEEYIVHVVLLVITFAVSGFVIYGVR